MEQGAERGLARTMATGNGKGLAMQASDHGMQAKMACSHHQTLACRTQQPAPLTFIHVDVTTDDRQAFQRKIQNLSIATGSTTLDSPAVRGLGCNAMAG
ncbi:Uncharacterised protein [Pseudomonas luteola]|uniref:Uncharacterized protein n=1 Tax=Pseudomonas luteola TaxID=47886 RepID=A0A2X2EAV7_PSELU|nr:Uncharacterised protein [Pseudomonas luteola]